MPNYDNLSQHTFLPFDVYKIKTANVFWVNYDLVRETFTQCDSMSDAEVDDFLIDNFAYMVPPEGVDFDKHFSQQTQTFYAERYGSHSERCNGGGVRCGNHMGVQIKGTGKNLLANGWMDFWHTHGGASLEEGVREAIWGEFFHQNAPFGAARILAVIRTGMDIDFDYNLESKEDNKAPGALMLRQPIVRPAHFERAHFFHNELPFDFYRVQDNCERLNQITGEAESKAFIQRQITYFAYLSAWLKVKRIAHGAITTGNIGVDGTMIDFGTTTSFLDHANYLISRGFPPFWGDHVYFSNILSTMNFYLGKYHSECFEKPKEIEELFFDTFNRYLSQFWLYQTGFDGAFCKIETPVHKRFSAGINLLAKACEETQHTPQTFRVPLARYNVVSILKILAKQKEEITIADLKAEIPEEKYAQHIVERFLDVLAAYAEWQAAINETDLKPLHVACEERNRDLIRLTRNELFKDITERVEQGDDVSGWIQEILQDSKLEPDNLPFELEAC